MAIPSNQVGFAFQGDVIAGASLLHSAGGRLLKAFSDGGIDIYAVNAAIWLGASIPIQTSHERMVSQKLKSRGWKTSFFNKALSIGWGHSEIAIQMASRRSGTAALLLIGALACGGSYYEAAEAFSKLLSATGCPSGDLPNVDVLKTMIAYLAPFTTDCGFLSVLQQVTAACVAARARSDETAEFKLKVNGADTKWVAGLRQLFFSAEKGEDVFLYARDRAPWLTAFASYILGMAVMLVDKDATIWQSAGVHGSVIVHLDEDVDLLRHAPTETKTGIRIIDVPLRANLRTMHQTYRLSEALETELSYYPQIANHDSLKTLICCDIVNYCLVSSNDPSLLDDSDNIRPGNHSTLYGLQSTALHKVFEQLGISTHVLATAAMNRRGYHLKSLLIDYTSVSHDFIIQSKVKDEVRKLCLRHGCSLESSKVESCLCVKIARLIIGFSRAIFNLSLCNFDSKELSVVRECINGTLPAVRVRLPQFGEVHLTTVLSELGKLLFLHSPQDNWRRTGRNLLALSSDNVTIYCNPVLEQDCLDPEGRVIDIVSGRLVLDGALRGQAEEGRPEGWSGRSRGVPPLTYQGAPGTFIQPHYIALRIDISISATLLEDSVSITCKTVNAKVRSEHQSLYASMTKLFEATSSPPCRHNTMRPLSVSDGGPCDIWVSGFTGDSNKGMNFFALKGHTLEQILQLSYLDGPTILQFSCLVCAKGLAQTLLQNGNSKVNIIMI